MKCCQKHWDAIRKIVADLDVAKFDTTQSSPAEPFDAVECCRLIEACAADPQRRPMLATVATLYAESVERFGPDILPIEDDGSHHCPLCVEREEFEMHRDGTCQNPDCPVPPVEAGAQPWDEVYLERIMTGLAGWARAEGMLGPLQ